MATDATESEHIVIVNFEIEPGGQDQALEKIGAYVGSFLSQQVGFIESSLHAGLDGNSVVHYARWQSEADFKAAGEGARAHPDMPMLMAYKPSGQGYRVWQRY
jgi:hypothetical protein